MPKFLHVVITEILNHTRKRTKTPPIYEIDLLLSSYFYLF